MIDGFTRSRIPCGEVTLSVHRAGRGHPLILIHGYPQNHRCWAPVAPALAERFDVIIPDLRGYGDSDAPADDADHRVYSKRTMAADIAALMDALDLPTAHVLGHDRGGRVAYRFALDHPDRLDRLGIIEIMTTHDTWAAWDADLGLKTYHWTFLAQPAPLPERMIAADPDGYVDWTLASWTRSRDLSAFAADALDSYRAQARDPARLAAMCADYRAGATTDRRTDAADLAAGRRIAAPLHLLLPDAGFPSSTADPVGAWRKWALQVTCGTCKAGHFVMEENPQAVLDAYLPVFTY